MYINIKYNKCCVALFFFCFARKNNYHSILLNIRNDNCILCYESITKQYNNMTIFHKRLLES